MPHDTPPAPPTGGAGRAARRWPRMRLRVLPPRRRAVGAAVLAASMTGGLVWLSSRTAQTSILTETIQVVGSLQPVDQTPLDFGAGGQVVSVDVKEGEAVSAGTVLASLDTTPMTTQLSQAQASLGAAQAKLTQDEMPESADVLASDLGAVATGQDQVASARTNLTDTLQANQRALATAQHAIPAAQAAGVVAIAEAQAVVTAAQANLADVVVADQRAVAGAQLAVTQAQQGTTTSLATAQAQANAAQKAVSDAQRVGAADVANAQAAVAAAQAAVTADQRAITVDQQRLTAAQNTERTDCGASPASAQCQSDQQTVADDQARLSADQGTLAQDQATVRTDQTAVAQQQTQEQQNIDQAQAQLKAAQVALASAQAQQGTAVQVARNALAQEVAKDQGVQHQAEAQLNAAAVALQAARSNAAANVQGAQDALSQAEVAAQKDADQAQTQLNAATVALQNAQRTLSAAERGPVPQLISSDQQGVDSANAQLTLAQHDLEASKIVAPVKGVVQHLGIFVGSKVESAGVSSPTSHAIVLFTPGAVSATGPVTDDRIRDVRLGDRASVQPAGDSRSIPGEVTQISPNPVVRSGVPAYNVTATLEETNLSLYPGMNARMTIVAQKASPSAVVVPRSAVHSVDGWNVVLVRGAKGPVARPVTLGIEDTTSVEITSGLSKDEKVITR